MFGFLLTISPPNIIQKMLLLEKYIQNHQAFLDALSVNGLKLVDSEDIKTKVIFQLGGIELSFYFTFLFILFNTAL